MQTVTLKIEDTISEKFMWFLSHFNKDEVSILDKDEYQSDDEYLRSINGMVESIIEARQEPMENSVTLDKLEW